MLCWIDSIERCALTQFNEIGVVTRLCMFDGEWDRVDTSNCTREDFAELAEMVLYYLYYSALGCCVHAAM